MDRERGLNATPSAPALLRGEQRWLPRCKMAARARPSSGRCAHARGAGLRGPGEGRGEGRGVGPLGPETPERRGPWESPVRPGPRQRSFRRKLGSVGVRALWPLISR